MAAKKKNGKKMVKPFFFFQLRWEAASSSFQAMYRELMIELCTEGAHAKEHEGTTDQGRLLDFDTLERHIGVESALNADVLASRSAKESPLPKLMRKLADRGKLFLCALRCLDEKKKRFFRFFTVFFCVLRAKKKRSVFKPFFFLCSPFF